MFNREKFKWLFTISLVAVLAIHVIASYGRGDKVFAQSS
jgi:hypothetical protein